ncbi:MAG: LpxI family protein [Hyphomicrobiaceae bacterium]
MATDRGRAAVDQSLGGEPDNGPLGILACAGQLPVEIARTTLGSGRAVHVVGIKGFVGEQIDEFSHERVGLGQVGRMLSSFHRAGVRQIVFAGAMQRPNLLSLRVDGGFFKALPTVLSLTRGGDDNVLRRVVKFFEKEGLQVVGVGDVAPALLAPEGRFSARALLEQETRALARARRLLAALGPFDIGQAVVATENTIAAVEGVRGTDAMLSDLGPGGIGAGVANGGVLLKLAKPGQEMRIDLPTIGRETVRLAHAAGIKAIGLGAGAAIVLDRERVAHDADEAGIALVGMPTGEGGTAPESDRRKGVEGGHDTPETDGLVADIVARRTPTPADRRDIHIARAVLHQLVSQNAGQAVIICREHVLGIAAALPLVPFVGLQKASASWGRRFFSRRLGVLIVDLRDVPRDQVVTDGGPISRELCQAAKSAGLAGIAILGGIDGDDARLSAAAWANEAELFLMAFSEGTAP